MNEYTNETLVRCEMESREKMEYALKEEKDGVHTGLQNFLEERGAGMEAQAFWRTKGRWGYEMAGHLDRWLAQHPRAVLQKQTRGSYGFVTRHYILSSGENVRITGADAETRFGRDY